MKKTALVIVCLLVALLSGALLFRFEKQKTGGPGELYVLDRFTGKTWFLHPLGKTEVVEAQYEDLSKAELALIEDATISDPGLVGLPDAPGSKLDALFDQAELSDPFEEAIASMRDAEKRTPTRDLFDDVADEMAANSGPWDDDEIVAAAPLRRVKIDPLTGDAVLDPKTGDVVWEAYQPIEQDSLFNDLPDSYQEKPWEKYQAIEQRNKAKPDSQFDEAEHRERGKTRLRWSITRAGRYSDGGVSGRLYNGTAFKISDVTVSVSCGPQRTYKVIAHIAPLSVGSVHFDVAEWVQHCPSLDIRLVGARARRK